MEKAVLTPNEIIEEALDRGISDKTDNLFINDHIFALGWMLANNFLEIKIAYVLGKDNKIDVSTTENTLFHQKVGICKDELGNIITFSGSVNESFKGWTSHIEEFKTFRYWHEPEKECAKSDLDKFDRFWNNESVKLNVISLPLAIKRKLIEQVPNDFSIEDIERHYKRKKIELFEYQQKAISNWIDNNFNGLFEMATGTGKTFTALGGLNHIIENQKKCFTCIAVPYGHLITQWKKEIETFGIECDEIIVADQTNKKWRDQLSNLLDDLSLGYVNSVILLTTHTTFSSANMKKILEDSKKNYISLLIADEVHGLGAKEFRKGLIDFYDYRLGLSATPKRFYDDKGTQILYDYFGGTVYEFLLKDAITKINPLTGKTYLTPYVYKPYFINLSEEEIGRYAMVTENIRNISYLDDEEVENIMTIY